MDPSALHLPESQVSHSVEAGHLCCCEVCRGDHSAPLCLCLGSWKLLDPWMPHIGHGETAEQRQPTPSGRNSAVTRTLSVSLLPRSLGLERAMASIVSVLLCGFSPCWRIVQPYDMAQWSPKSFSMYPLKNIWKAMTVFSN